MNRIRKVVLSWSGGKDSAMALYELGRRRDLRVVELLTTVAEPYDRISHHGVRAELLDQQAAAVGVPLRKLSLPDPCTNDDYERLMAREMARCRDLGVGTVCFGDIFLHDLRAYRERKLAAVGMKAIFPIWQRDTREMVQTFIDLGFRAYLSCVDGNKLPRSFAGRPIDAALIRDLPEGVDPCGENGEFHSFVYDGPLFDAPIDLTVGEVVDRDTRFFAELLPQGNDRAGRPAPPRHGKSGVADGALMT